MKGKQNIVKSKRLKVIRGMMYLDILLILLSVMMIDFRYFSFEIYSGVCIRIVVLLALFMILLVTEKNLIRYLRKHRSNN